MTKLAPALVSVLLAASCSSPPFIDPPRDAGTSDGGTQTDAGGDGGVPRVDGGLPLSSACDTLVSRRCQYLSRCGLVARSAEAMRDCRAYFTATWCSPSRWPALVQASTLNYDPFKAKACADAYADPARACGDWALEPPECQSFLGPKANLNQRCYGRYGECRDGVCRGATCPAACLPRGGLNEDCDEDSDCAVDDGLYCLVSPSTGGGKCVAYGQFGDSCDVDRVCGSALFCNNLGQCEQRRQPGQACLSGTCTEDAWCHFTPQDGGFCELRQPEGVDCTDDVQCLTGLLCDSIRDVCVASGTVADGGECSLRQSCSRENTCVGATPTTLGTCLAPLEHGEPCTSSVDCRLDLACAARDGGSAVCGDRLEDGTPCVTSRECRIFSRCVNDVCTRLPLPGSPCLNGSCLFGTCEVTPDGGRVCGNLGGPGASCLSDLECSSGRCLAGRCMAACAP